MAGNKAPRKAYRPKPVHANAHQLAMAKVHKLRQQDLADQCAVLDTALRSFSAGQRCAHHWRSLADAANVCASLAALGICAGSQATEIIECAQRVLHDVLQRHRARGSWTLYPLELDTLYWLLALHKRQLAECDYSEFNRALDLTQARVAQARAGNAPAGAIVVEGEIS